MTDDGKGGAALEVFFVCCCRYAGFSTAKPLLQDNLQYTDSILVYVGPQASCLHEDLYDR